MILEQISPVAHFLFSLSGKRVNYKEDIWEVSATADLRHFVSFSRRRTLPLSLTLMKNSLFSPQDPKASAGRRCTLKGGRRLFGTDGGGLF